MRLANTGVRMTQQQKVRIDSEELLSDNWYILKKIGFSLQRRNGEWQHQTREVYSMSCVRYS